MINHQWLELHMSRTDFHDPKDVRAIEEPLRFDCIFIQALGEVTYFSDMEYMHTSKTHVTANLL